MYVRKHMETRFVYMTTLNQNFQMLCVSSCAKWQIVKIIARVSDTCPNQTTLYICICINFLICLLLRNVANKKDNNESLDHLETGICN